MVLMILGFTFLMGKPVQAACLEVANGKCEADEGISFSGAIYECDKDCNGYCNPGDDQDSYDCDDSCDDTNSGYQGNADKKDSADCDNVCAGNDAKCSSDCDPLGQCQFGAGTDLTSSDARTIIARLINIVLGLLGTVAVVMVLIGGFKWMSSGGDDTEIAKARKYVISGVIGMAIVLAAYSIASFVIKGLTQATEE